MVKQAPFNPVISRRLKEAHQAFHNWTLEDRPVLPHPAAVARKTANRLLRSAQRQQVAIDRSKSLETLHTASETNQNLMYSIIKRQRSTTRCTTNELIIDDHVYTGDLLPAWVKHFSRLALPGDNPNFTTARQDHAKANLKLIQEISSQSQELSIPITTAEIRYAINQLKLKKASDVVGLVSEHLKSATTIIANYLTPVFNTIISMGEYPTSLKEGIRHPIPKKDKIITDPGNFRGISITPIIGKVLDHIHLNHQRPATTPKFHPLQFGFSEGRSCVQAAFLVSECIADSKDRGLSLFIASIDVQKAFDVIPHASLLDRLHQFGLRGSWWRLKESAYTDLKERIIWHGNKSTPFPIKVGSKQGAYPSPDDYITHLCTLIFMASTSSLGYSIGNINVNVPTCADDMIIMATTPFQLQALITLATMFANDEHHVIHPKKTVIVPYHVKSSSQLNFLKEESPWTTNNVAIPVKDEMVHLGIKRNISQPNVTVDDRVTCARKTMFSMMGCGLHGFNGLPVKTSLKLYNAYILPRAMYGLEALRISETAKERISGFHRYAMRSVLSLPKWTAIPALHILSGQIPMEYQLDVRILTFIHSLITTKLTKDVVLRQYVIKPPSSHSLIGKFKEKLHVYHLPSIVDLYMDPPTKSSWKRTVKTAVVTMASRSVTSSAKDMSTLQHMSHQFIHKHPHPVVALVDNPRQVERACIKAQVLTGTYPLQRARFKMKKTSSPTCQMCQRGEEDTTHFVVGCSSLNETRAKYSATIRALLPTNLKVPLTMALLDSRTLIKEHPELASLQKVIEQTTRDLIFALHLARCKILEHS